MLQRLRLTNDVEPQRGIGWLHRHHPYNLCHSVTFHDCEVVKWFIEGQRDRWGWGLLNPFNMEASRGGFLGPPIVHSLDLLTHGGNTERWLSARVCGSLNPSPTQYGAKRPFSAVSREEWDPVESELWNGSRWSVWEQDPHYVCQKPTFEK